MEKGLVFLIVSGVAAFWLFLSFGQTHDAERNVLRATVERDSAEFDRDFQQARGKDSTLYEQRVADSEKRLAGAQKAEAAVVGQQNAQRQALQSAANGVIEEHGVDLSKTTDQINRAIGAKP